MSWQKWKILNWQKRVFSFSKGDSQLRRNWLVDRGTLVVIVEDGSWILEKSSGRPRMNLPRLRTISQFRTLFSTRTREALAAVDIHVYRTDITFDKFRIEDAELYKQHYPKQMDVIFKGLLWDTIFAGLLSLV